MYNFNSSNFAASAFAGYAFVGDGEPASQGGNRFPCPKCCGWCGCGINRARRYLIVTFSGVSNLWCDPDACNAFWNGTEFILELSPPGTFESCTWVGSVVNFSCVASPPFGKNVQPFLISYKEGPATVYEIWPGDSNYAKIKIPYLTADCDMVELEISGFVTDPGTLCNWSLATATVNATDEL